MSGAHGVHEAGCTFLGITLSSEFVMSSVFIRDSFSHFGGFLMGFPHLYGHIITAWTWVLI